MRSFKLAILLFALLACISLAATESLSVSAVKKTATVEEAPTGFDDKTNGFITQREFDEAMGFFNRHHFERDGLGPVFNAETCLRCHQFPTVGGFSLNTVTRAGRFDGKNFVAHPGGTVIQVAATNPQFKETVMPGFDIVVPRLSISLLGDGFIEAIGDDTLRAIAREQAKKTNGKIAGEVVEAPVLESSGAKRVGRFGWKSAHASLVSFVGEAFLNELGLTNPLFPKEITSGGKALAPFDSARKPEIDMARVEMVTRFIRATKAPARDVELAKTNDAKAGERLFESVGCAVCHVPTIKTMTAGSVTNGGKFAVTKALGDKFIHPFSDFLLHDVATGDGIVEVGPLSTRNKIRTAPLWGLGARVNRLGDHLVLLHDGSATSLNDAILRHGGEASAVTEQFKKLSTKEREQLITYLKSL